MLCTGPRPERGTTPSGFRQRLLALLRNASRQQGVSSQRLQHRVAFERLLARLSHEQWLLKGGFALELRYSWTHRPTKDIDLRTELPIEEALALIRGEVSRQTGGDPFSFELGITVSEMQGGPGGALRIPVMARLAGSVFAQFHLDVSSGDAVIGEADVMVGSDLLEFAGIEPVRFPTYPVTQHLAEKLHAYTLPRDQENTRAKDLVDLVALAPVEPVDGNRLMASIQATFQTRATHTLPGAFPQPPARWSTAFLALLAESPMTPIAHLDEGVELAAQFWNLVLADAVRGMCWVPATRRWRARDTP
jgi:predicted nucleotidyltransferase component of viral defense system